MPEARTKTPQLLRRRLLLAGAVLVLAYVFAGELLQAWVRLHADAWASGPGFGGAQRHEAEWHRVDAALATGTRIWPWKSSLQMDVARVALFGYYAGYLERSDAGPEVLAAVARAKTKATEDGILLTLEIRGHLLVGDAPATRAAILRLRQAAPHARPWWEPLLPLLCDFALGDVALQSAARETLGWYANSDPDSLRVLARRYPAVKAFAPTLTK